MHGEGWAVDSQIIFKWFQVNFQKLTGKQAGDYDR